MHPLRTRWAYVLFAYFCLFALGFLDNARGPAFPSILSDLNLSDERGSWLFSAASITSFVASYSCRWVLPLSGSLWLLRLGLMIMAVGAAAIGQSESLLFLIFGSALLGFGQGVTAVSQHTLIQENSPESQWRRLFSGLHSTYGFASLLAPLGYAHLMGLGWHWSRVFLLFSAIPILVLLSSSLLAARRIPATPPVRHKVMGDSIGRQYFWVALFLGGYLVGELSISTRLVLLLQRGRGLAADQAAHALTGFFSCCFCLDCCFSLSPSPVGRAGRSFSFVWSALCSAMYWPSQDTTFGLSSVGH